QLAVAFGLRLIEALERERRGGHRPGRRFAHFEISDDRCEFAVGEGFVGHFSSPRFRGEVAARRADGGAPPPHFVRSPSPANAGEDIISTSRAEEGSSGSPR